MKVKRILIGIGFIVFFFIAVNTVFKSNGTRNYEFETYKKTIDSSISGTVKRLVIAKNFFGAQFGVDPNNYFGFTYHVERTPEQWLKKYPKDFIIMGDSILKKANNDTFFVIREANVWVYILPKDSTLTK